MYHNWTPGTPPLNHFRWSPNFTTKFTIARGLTFIPATKSKSEWFGQNFTQNFGWSKRWENSQQSKAVGIAGERESDIGEREKWLKWKFPKIYFPQIVTSSVTNNSLIWSLIFMYFVSTSSFITFHNSRGKSFLKFQSRQIVNLTTPKHTSKN